MSIVDRIKDLIIKEEWTLALRKRGRALLFEDGGTEKEFLVLKNSLRYWAADPFLFLYQGKDYIFFEKFDRFKSKGLIGYREIINGKATKMKVAYEADFHLSFPFIFEKDGDVYNMPEYSYGKSIAFLKSTHFPDKWEKVSEILEGRRYVDSALVEYNNTHYLFTQDITDGYNGGGLSVYYEENGEWLPHKNNPLVTDSAVSRLGGRVLNMKGKLIRVCQDCSEDYGTKLHFQQIDEFSEDSYEEHNIRNIETNDIKLLSKKNNYRGIHTYNYNDGYEVIDLKNKDKIRIGNVVNMFSRLFL